MRSVHPPSRRHTHTHLAELRVERAGDVVVGLHAVGDKLGRQVSLRHHAQDLAVHRDDRQRVEALRREQADGLFARHAGGCTVGVGLGSSQEKVVKVDCPGWIRTTTRTDGDGRLEVEVLHTLLGPPRLVLRSVDQPLWVLVGERGRTSIDRLS